MKTPKCEDCGKKMLPIQVNQHNQFGGLSGKFQTEYYECPELSGRPKLAPTSTNLVPNL